MLHIALQHSVVFQTKPDQEALTLLAPAFEHVSLHLNTYLHMSSDNHNKHFQGTQISNVQKDLMCKPVLNQRNRMIMRAFQFNSDEEVLRSIVDYYTGDAFGQELSYVYLCAEMLSCSRKYLDHTLFRR